MKEEVLLVVNKDVELRPWKIEWAPKLFNLAIKNREYLLPWLPWVPGVKKVEDSEEFIKNSLKEQKEKSGLELGIWYENKLAGCLGLHGFSKDHRRVNIGCWIDKDYQGKGIVTKSLKKLIEYCFGDLNLNRIGYRAAVSNEKSLAVAERLSFIRGGVLRDFEYVNKRFLDYVSFSLLKKDSGNY